METVVLPGLPGLADPPVGEALIQEASVATPHESVPEELVMVTFWGGGTCPDAEVKDREDGETPSMPVIGGTTFKMTFNVATWDKDGP